MLWCCGGWLDVLRILYLSLDEFLDVFDGAHAFLARCIVHVLLRLGRPRLTQDFLALPHLRLTRLAAHRQLREVSTGGTQLRTHAIGGGVSLSRGTG